MNIHNTFAAAFVAILLGGTILSSAQAQEVNERPQAEMVSGGIGDTGMDKIAAAQKDYSLKLIFAETSGDYLADVGVVIHDRKGNTVVNMDSAGPILLVKLKPGAYTVSSSTDKETTTSKVVVNNTGIRTYYIHLNASES